MISPEIEKIYKKELLLRNGIALFIFLIPLIYGSVHYFVLITEYVLALALILSYFFINREIKLIKPSLIFLLFIGFTLLITLIQLIPLPLAIVRFLSFREYELLTEINSLYTGIIEPIKFFTLSIEPYINMEYLIRIIVFLFIFIIASQDEFAKTGILLKSIAYCGALIVLYGFVDALLNFKTYYSQNIHLTNVGILPSIFINPNHQAGFLGLATFTGLSLYYSTEAKNEKIIFLFCSILSGAGIFLTISRGGIIAFAASLIFLSALLFRERLSIQKSLIFSISILIIIIFSFYLAYQEISSEIATLMDMKRIENEKYRLVLNSVNLFKDFILLGVGKGGFETIFNLYRDDTIFVSFSLMENQIFQQLADYGVFYFIIMLGIIVYFSYTFLRQNLTIRTSILVAGIFYILLQNLVDFNLEIFSVQIAFIVIIATLIYRLSYLKTEGRESVYNPIIIRIKNITFYSAAIILIIVFILVILISSSNRKEKIEAETELMLNAGLSSADSYFIDRIKKFPFDYYIPAAIAAKNYLDTTNSVIRSYLFHSSLINPIAFEPHYMLYRHFLKKGEYANAQSECRMALRYSRDNKTRLIFSELLRSVKKNELFKYIPYTPATITSFADYLISVNEVELAKEFIEDALYISEKNPDVIKSAFNIYIRLNDLKNAEKTLKMYEEIDKGFNQNLLRGLLYEIQKKYEDALKEYIIADTKDPLNAKILMKIGDINKKMGRVEEARQNYLKIFLCDGINNDTKVQVYVNIADTYLMQKNNYDALRFLRTAQSMKPLDTAIKFRIASICERNGNLNCALNEYRGILILNPENTFASSKVQEIEKRLKEIEEYKRLEQLKK